MSRGVIHVTSAFVIRNVVRANYDADVVDSNGIAWHRMTQNLDIDPPVYNWGAKTGRGF